LCIVLKTARCAIRLIERRVERRKAPRRMVANLTAHYWEGTGAAGHAVRDISARGAFIFADFKWMPGTTLTMTRPRSFGRGWLAKPKWDWGSVYLCRQGGAKNAREFSGEYPGGSSVMTIRSASRLMIGLGLT
jgi:hypothetical protein